MEKLQKVKIWKTEKNKKYRKRIYQAKSNSLSIEYIAQLSPK